MSDYKRLFRGLLREESGQDLVEYALVAAMIGLGATATMRTFTTAFINTLSSIGTRLTNSV
jgi:pilus assembly protein Flp/PilA